MAKLKGWRYGLFIGGIVGVISLAIYPIIIHPLMNVEEYQQSQEFYRAGLKEHNEKSIKSRSDSPIQ